MPSSATGPRQARPTHLPPAASQSQTQAQSHSQLQHKSPATCPIPIKDRSNVNALAMQDGSFLSISQFHRSLAADHAGSHSHSLGDTPLAFSSGHSPSNYWPGSAPPTHGERYRPLQLSPGSQMIGSDASNLAEDQTIFDSAYPLDFDYDGDQQNPLSPDQSYFVTGTGGLGSFDPDDTLLDPMSLEAGSMSPRLHTADQSIEDELAASFPGEKDDEIRNLSTMQVFQRTFGSDRFESPVTSGSAFPSLDSTLTSSYTQSFPAPNRFSVPPPRPSSRNPLEDLGSTWSSSATAGTQELRRRASSLTKQRQRSRASSSNSMNPNGPRKAVRKGPLQAETRERAGKMRAKKACGFCHSHKRACALETPCSGCIQQYGNDILNHPCRESLAECITYVAMHNDAKWFPQGRSLGDFNLEPTNLATESYTIPVVTAFGPPMHLHVHVFDTNSEDAVRHRHVVQTPEHRTQRNLCYLCDDLVLPIALSNPETLATEIDRHVTKLVDNHFQDFSWYRDQFNALEMVYALYLHFRNNQSRRYATLIQKSLRLLCLIHACDISVSTNDSVVREIYTKHIWTKFKPDNRENAGLTACYLRAGFGRVIPDLARTLMIEILQSLFQIYSEDGADRLPVVVSVNVLLMMTLESIMSRGARIPYHFLLCKGSLPSSSVSQSSCSGPDGCLHRSSSSSSSASGNSLTLDQAAYTPNYTSLHNGEACARVLIKRYRASFGSQHDAFFSPDAHLNNSEAELHAALGPVPASFVVNMGALVRGASSYLMHKKATPFTAQPNDNAQDIGQVFDCLTARFFLDKGSG